MRRIQKKSMFIIFRHGIYRKNVAGGVLGRAVVAVNQMGIGTTLTDLTGLSVTITTPGGRWIKISRRGVGSCYRWSSWGLCCP